MAVPAPSSKSDPSMLKTRILTALVLLPLVLAALFAAPPLGWGVFVAVVCTLGAWEWGRFAALPRIGALLYAAVTALAVLGWLYTPPTAAATRMLDYLALLFWLLIAPLWLHFKWKLAPRSLALAVGWLLLLATFNGLLRWRALPNGPWLLLAVLAIAWIADTAAYFTGRKFGKRKLAPSISPGKSWEGVWGALLAVVAYAVLLDQLHLPVLVGVPLWLLWALLWALTAVSIVGDLLESLYKRQIGIKDSSQLLPGHGGVLDRIDSLLAIVPVASALLFTVFAR